MDLNHLFSRHQVALIQSEHAFCGNIRRAHRALAAGYAAEIRTMQLAAGASFPLSAGNGSFGEPA